MQDFDTLRHRVEETAIKLSSAQSERQDETQSLLEFYATWRRNIPRRKSSSHITKPDLNRLSNPMLNSPRLWKTFWI